MEQYISKSALLAEIERLVNNYDKALDYEAALEDVRDFLDSIEVKDVDLDKEFNNFLDNVEGVPPMWHSNEQIGWAKDIARHFYELGLQAQKEVEPQVKESAEIQHKDKSCKENDNSLTKEPVSEVLCAADNNSYKYIESVRGAAIQAFEDGAKWQKAKYESTTEDLGDYINELSKQFPEVSFAKLSRIAVRVSRWQQNQDVKNKLPKVTNRTDLDEYAYQCAYDISNDWAIENPTWKDVEDACKLGANWQKEQMMAKAGNGRVDSMSNRQTRAHITVAFDSPRDIEVLDRLKVIVIKED